ncbi:MAG TPA: c-type cytochrome [Alphaproteobacteria bacterium]|nr:c-type cytochrome [Alphaproteobacteria bacterium]
MAGCDLSDATPSEDKVVENGDPAHGRALIASGVHGCTTCHAVPGIRGVQGGVGLPLDGLARRGFIAGQLPNVPGALVAFLKDPPALVPSTGMPNVGLTPEEARHIAAYLHTLEPSDARSLQTPAAARDGYVAGRVCRASVGARPRRSFRLVHPQAGDRHVGWRRARHAARDGADARAGPPPP